MGCSLFLVLPALCGLAGHYRREGGERTEVQSPNDGMAYIKIGSKQTRPQMKRVDLLVWSASNSDYCGTLVCPLTRARGHASGEQC